MSSSSEYNFLLENPDPVTVLHNKSDIPLDMEEMFKVYNYLLGKYSGKNQYSDADNITNDTPIKFLFAARTEEMKQLTDFLKLNERKEVEYSQILTNGSIQIEFDRDEPGKIVRKAFETTSNEDKSLVFIDDPITAIDRIGGDILIPVVKIQYC